MVGNVWDRALGRAEILPRIVGEQLGNIDLTLESIGFHCLIPSAIDAAFSTFNRIFSAPQNILERILTYSRLPIDATYPSPLIGLTAPSLSGLELAAQSRWTS